MSEILTETVTVTTVGADGSALGSAQSKALKGFLLDIKLDYHASAPAGTTDLTVSDDYGTILTISNSVTDALIAPRQKPVDNANSAITNAHDRFPLAGPLTFAVAQCNALTAALVATIRYITP